LLVEIVMQEIRDKAGEAYWTSVWEKSDLNPPIDLQSKDMHSYPQRAFNKIFRKFLNNIPLKGKKLVEIGCGNSSWLPYFSKQFGLDVYGIDYSEEGCEQAEKILQRENVEGTIYCTDAFNPVEDLYSEFDIVVSFGVIEHFSDTASTLEAFSKYLKPGGLLITAIPNMSGLNGWLHKKMNRALYDIHVPLDKKQLSEAVRAAGLNEIKTHYYIGVSLNVQLTDAGEPIKNFRMKRIISKAGAGITLFFWWLEEKIGVFPQSKMFSRGIFSIAKKPF
jgi:2-polyprenyl-3-methyl-5-hydroxy-6-metoxy-1,4-benzoquinol methylase